MLSIKKHLSDIEWEARTSGELIIDGVTYEVWSSYQLEEDLMESLNESYPEYKIGVFTFPAGKILKECDPIGFDVCMSEHADSLKHQKILVYGYTLFDEIANANETVETENTYLASGVE